MYDLRKYNEILKPIIDAGSTLPNSHFAAFELTMQQSGWDNATDENEFTRTFGKYVCTYTILRGNDKTVLSDPFPSRFVYLITFQLSKKTAKSQKSLEQNCFVWIPNLLNPADALEFAKRIDDYADARVEEAISPTPEE